MWKDYVRSLLRNNRSYGLSVKIAVFISALLLSLSGGLFYNAWKYEVERIERESGSWQSRILDKLTVEDIKSIKNFASVKDVVINEKESRGEKKAVDIYFKDMGSVFSDTPKIAELTGVLPEKVIYNYELLAMYLIRSKEDAAPRLLLPMFFIIMAMASFSLIMMIHNAFAVSMNARIYQFGIFSSIGATPKQIRTCLLQEAAFLCAAPVAVGNLLGVAGSMGILQMINVLLGSNMKGRHDAVFGYHPWVFVLTVLATAITIGISAWLPAGKLSRLTPLEAIRSTDELQLRRKKNSYLFSLLFGVEGELAGNALKAQRKALRTSSLSLIVSLLAFMVMQCFFSLSAMSTRETYFERYQGVWDIMVTVKDTKLDVFKDTEAVQKLAGVENAIVYQKAAAKTIITEGEISEDMMSVGSFSHASNQYVKKVDDGWLVNAPVLILDDNSFLTYCEQLGISPRLDGAVIRNQIKDVTNPDFRHPDLLPYVNGENAVRVLIRSVEDQTSYEDTHMSDSSKEKMTAEVSVLSYTEKVPELREEYAAVDAYELVYFIPVSLWKQMRIKVGGTQEDTIIRVLSRENETLEQLNTLQSKIHDLLGEKYTIASENRIQKYEMNNKQIQGMMAIFGGFCVLPAMIGIGNVFSNTLGFVRQRKREFARYLSVGLTPKEFRKMFCIEAVAIAVRPILMATPLAVVAVGYMLKLSYLEAGEFLAEAPIVPIVIFMLAIAGSVALAYYAAWRNVRNISLAETLKDDTMM